MQHVAIAGMAAATAGCSPLSTSVVSLDDSEIVDRNAVSVLASDASHPLLIRGLDDQLIPKVRVPNPLRTWEYEVSAGTHVLWLTDVPAGVPWLPQRLHCYALDVNLEPGERYILQHDGAGKRAMLVRARDGEIRAATEPMDEPLVMERSCRWK